MKNIVSTLSKTIVSLLVIISILLNSPVYAEEIRLNSGTTISVVSLDNNRFEISKNVYSKGRLLFGKGTVGSRNVGHVVDATGNYHYFVASQAPTKKSSARIGKHGPKVVPLIGAVAATAVAVPIVGFLAVVQGSTNNSIDSSILIPFIPAAFFVGKAFEED
ncbi:MAG: hypothetical protein A3I68_05985 [Candidatus Melainabacteria bacterium RIFCSPLOWO2_02_FULL_35_15]|nr:MAG: hypothetical protein A3F80_02185 [Candidatus Melainabacteria bacterium RIFCSPLOWO2_12_FULL_35_11]OGI13752.1 MAG: hypothetical protein A3I68_05985 [Candidatus Melainabacteria bacterium RIFCSPLOWO2_02_FULL_35_15]